MAKKDTLSKYKAFKEFLKTYDMNIQPADKVKKKALTQEEMLAKANALIN